MTWLCSFWFECMKHLKKYIKDFERTKIFESQTSGPQILLETLWTNYKSFDWEKNFAIRIKISKWGQEKMSTNIIPHFIPSFDNLNLQGWIVFKILCFFKWKLSKQRLELKRNLNSVFIDYRNSSIKSQPSIILDPKFPRLVLEVIWKV